MLALPTIQTILGGAWSSQNLVELGYSLGGRLEVAPK